MTGKTHQIIGISAGLTAYIATVEPAYNPSSFAAVLVFSYLAALLPDIDQPSSKLWHYIPFGHVAAEVTDPFIEHRNITHSILGAAIIATGFWFLLKLVPPYWGVNTFITFITFITSYLFHLLADMFTNQGIPLFFPWQKFFGLPPKPLDGMRIATGKWFENLIIFPIFTIYLLALILTNLETIKIILFKYPY